MSGISSCFSVSHKASSQSIPWIIDTGATDHMICCTSIYTSLPTKVHFTVKFSNDTHANVTHKGIVQLNNTLTLKDVLCVPSFNFNLLSAKKLTQDLNCCFIFFTNECYVQDLFSWSTIGKGEANNGLYQLQLTEVSPTALSSILSKLLSIILPFLPLLLFKMIIVYGIVEWVICLTHVYLCCSSTYQI